MILFCDFQPIDKVYLAFLLIQVIEINRLTIFDATIIQAG